MSTPKTENTDPKIVVAPAPSVVTATPMEVTDAVALSQQPTVTITAPLIPGEKPVTLEAWINGMKYELVPNIPTDVPHEVYKIFLRAGKIGPLSAEDNHEYPFYNVDPQVAAALGNGQLF